MSPHEVPLIKGMQVKLLEGNWIHDAFVAGQGAGFVSIQIGTATRLVRRHSIYSLPQERRRLRDDLQQGINQLESMLDLLSRIDDPIAFEPQEQEEHDAR